MKTKTPARKRTPLKKWNWLTFLRQAIARPPDQKTYARAKHEAGRWPTCACGQLCKRLPRDIDGSPQDVALYNLGLCFNSAISRQGFSAALKHFQHIEQRTAFLLSHSTTKN